MTAEPVAEGLNYPVAFTIDAQGEFLYAERETGQIRTLSADGTRDSLWATIPGVVHVGEQGLLSLALHPAYPATPHVYAYAIRVDPEYHDTKPRYQVLRFTDDGAEGSDMEVVFDAGGFATDDHVGAAMTFGPDGMLYLMIGDGLEPAWSQDVRVPQGKILRMRPDGGVPTDNPLPGRVFTYGHRNAFGLAVDPATGNLWEAENGPECNDEVNLVVGGDNYGWGPKGTCSHPPATPENTNQDGRRPHLPELVFETVIAPTGMTFCDGCGLGPDTEGTIVMADFLTRSIHRLELDAERTGIVAESALYDHDVFTLSVESGPDGTIYFSDHDGIYRLTGPS